MVIGLGGFAIRLDMLWLITKEIEKPSPPEEMTRRFKAMMKGGH